jgi:pullulanase
MTSAADIAKNLKFDKVSTPNVISYSLLNNANGDEWKEIKLVFNGSDNDVEVKLPKGKWTIIARDGQLNHTGLLNEDGTVATLPGGKTTVEHRSALILAR